MADEDTTNTAVAEPGSDDAAKAETDAQEIVQAAIDKTQPAGEADTDVAPEDGKKPDAADDKADTKAEEDKTKGSDNAPKPKEDTKAKDTKPQPKDDDSDSLNLTAQQLEAKKQFGMSDEDVKALGADAGNILDTMNVKLTTKMAEIGRQQQKLSKADDTELAKKDETTGAPEPSAAVTDAKEFTEGDMDLDDETQATPIIGKVNDLLRRLVAVETSGRERQEQEHEATVDGYFSGLWQTDDKGESTSDHPQFGNGRGSDFAEDSDEHKARIELVEQATAIKLGHKAMDRTISVEQSLKDALSIVARDQIQDIERQKIAAELKHRSKKGTRRTTSRVAQPTAESTDADRLNIVRKAMKDAGTLGETG